MPFLERPDGCRLWYQLTGPGDGSPLLLLEGLGGDIPGWRRNIPHLSARHRVIAYDFRGNGRSDKPNEPMSMETFVDDTAALLDDLEAGPAHVYGQSFGGMVAQELALDRPACVRSLVLAATHGGTARASKGERASRNVPKGRPYLALYSEEFARTQPEHVTEDLRVGLKNPQPAYAGRRQWEAFQAWDAWDRLGGIACPTLVLHGTEDRMVAVDNARRLAAAIPGAELVLMEGAGHLYHSERADEADRIVLEFLAKVEAG